MKITTCIAFLSLLLVFSGSLAQRIKYKDLVPLLETSSDDQAIPMLNEFLVSERDNPNANFRLGLLYAKKYKATDPLKEFEKAMEYANRAKLQMVKSKTLIDNREVNRNSEQYVTLATEVQGNKVEFTVIQQMMDREYQEAETFMQNLPPVYQSFTKAVANYDLAKKEYAKIAEKYSSIKELLLLYNKDLENQLTTLQSVYDSALFYFDKYKQDKSSVKVPYDQSYTVKPIVVYRKDGLATQTNFLAATIEFWDYKTWVEDIFKEEGSSITDLREQLNENQQKISSNLQKIKNGMEVRSFVTISRELIFKLGRYDYQTAIVPLLQFEEFQQEYIIRKNELTKFDQDTTIALQTRLNFYTELLYKSIKADSIITDLLNKTADTDKLQRHRDFLEENFKGIEGLQAYAQSEKTNLTLDYDNFVKSIKKRVNEIEAAPVQVEKSVTYQRNSIPLFIDETPLDSLSLNHYATKVMEINPDGSRYLAGVVMRSNKTKEKEVFVAKIDPKEKVNWLKFYNLEIDDNKSPANHSPTAIRPTQLGVLLAINSHNFEESKTINSLVYLSDSGAEIFASKMDSTGSAQSINYDENTRSFILTYFDPTLTENLKIQQDVTVSAVTDSGSVIWEKKLLMGGAISKVINVFEGVMILGTGNYWKSDKGELKSSQTGLIMSTISLDGVLKNQRLVEGFRMGKVTKVNDSNISISVNASGGALPAGSPDFIITNSQLQMLYPRK